MADPHLRVRPRSIELYLVWVPRTSLREQLGTCSIDGNLLDREQLVICSIDGNLLDQREQLGTCSIDDNLVDREQLGTCSIDDNLLDRYGVVLAIEKLYERLE